MNENEIKLWLEKQAKNYRMCLEAASNNIDSGILGYIEDGKTVHLRPEDYRQIASSLYIQGNRAGVFREEGDPNPPRRDDFPSTEKQQQFIARLAAELGSEADEVLDQHLRLSGKAVVDALSKEEATNLITALKEEKNRRKKK